MALTQSDDDSDPGLFRACATAGADGRAQKAAAAHAAAAVRAGKGDGLQPGAWSEQGVSQKKMDKLLSLGDETHLPLAYFQRKSGLATYENLRAVREPRVSLRAPPRPAGARGVEARGGERLGEQDRHKALTTEEMRAVAGFSAPCPGSYARWHVLPAQLSGY